jgi:acylpyruvate hydrolase
MKIICIGRNYVEHAVELKNEVPTEPVFFMKPDTALLAKGKDFFLPDFSKDIHHEVELVIRICKEGKHIAEEFANKYYDQVTVGLDFTARDIQEKQKAKGLPWEPAKAFDWSAPVGDFISFDKINNKDDIAFSLKKNGNTVQEGRSSLMIFSFEKIISNVSRYITLRKGDFIFTGTPKGVGKIDAGDKLEAFLEGEKLLSVNVK